MNDSIADTIVPKSDQLNADDLMTGPQTFTVRDVKRSSSADQPIAIDVGVKGRPYKPCKSMRRVMVGIWGESASGMIGQSFTLFRNPAVMYGGKAVGGIQISHMSGVDKPTTVMLTVRRGVREEYTVQPLTMPAKQSTEVTQDRVDKMRAKLLTRLDTEGEVDSWISDELKRNAEEHRDAKNWTSADMQNCINKWTKYEDEQLWPAK